MSFNICLQYILDWQKKKWPSRQRWLWKLERKNKKEKKDATFVGPRLLCKANVLHVESLECHTIQSSVMLSSGND